MSGRLAGRVMAKSFLQTKYFSTVLLILLGLFLFLILKIEPPLRSISKEVNNLNQKIAEVDKNRSDLEKSKDYFKSNAYLEKQARLKLNYKKQDENVVFIYKKAQSQGSEQGANSAIKGGLFFENQIFRNLRDWFYYLIGK